MERTGQGTRGGPGLYLPRDPNAPVVYDELYTGPPSLYVDPASVQAAPFNPNASPIEAQQMPYVPNPPPESWELEDQRVLRG